MNVIDEPRTEAGSPKAGSDIGAAGSPLSPDPVEGYIDGIQNRRVFGWAWCRSRPTDPVDVEIRFDDQVLLTVRADRFRPDLAKAGLTDGRHGFEAVLEDGVAADQKARITAYGRCGANDPWVPLVNRTIKAATKATVREDGAAPPSKPIADLQPILNGLAALQKRMDERIATWRAELRAHAESDAQAIRDQLTMLTSATDVLQMRIDAVCAALREGTAAAPSSRRGDRTLMLVVAALGVVSCASLLLGLIAVLG